MDYIKPEEILAQRWKFYAGLVAWPLYLFLIPWAFARLGYVSLLLIVFPGLFLFSWTGYLMHESWHKYVPGLPHDAMYTLYSWMLVTDPQIYRMLHGHHHSEVNTWEDREFHPAGEIKSREWRRIYHFAEIFLGVAFIVAVTSLVIPTLEKYRTKFRLASLLTAIVAWVVIIGGLGWASAAVFGLAAGQVVIPFAVTLYLGSVLVHLSQLVEHGNLIVAGSWDQRNVRTRNLQNRTWLEKWFLFTTHGDSREHVLHHTMTRVYSRPFPGRVPMPAAAVVISWTDFIGILGDMLAGRDSSQ